MHVDQVEISTVTVRTLVDAQFPKWRDEPIRTAVSSGTDNAIFLIGSRLAARLPLRLEPPDRVRRRLQREADAARRVAAASPVPTPEPVALGEPGPGYPMPWSVQTWLPGTVASEAGVDGSIELATDLAGFVAAMRGVDTDGARFSGAGRGGDLTAHDDWMAECFQRSADLLDVSRLRRAWHHLRALPREGSDVMTHGDLIPANLLVSGDRLAGVLDVGGFGPADPALDLVGAWHALDDGPRQVFREALGCDDLEWERGKAWAFQQSMGLVWYYVDSNPTMSRMGRRTLARVVDALP